MPLSSVLTVTVQLHAHTASCLSINHSAHKTKNVTQKAGREEGSELGLITTKVPEEEWVG